MCVCHSVLSVPCSLLVTYSASFVDHLNFVFFVCCVGQSYCLVCSLQPFGHLWCSSCGSFLYFVFFVCCVCLSYVLVCSLQSFSHLWCFFCGSVLLFLCYVCVSVILSSLILAVVWSPMELLLWIIFVLCVLVCCVYLSYCLVCSLQSFGHLRSFFCGSLLYFVFFVCCVCLSYFLGCSLQSYGHIRCFFCGSFVFFVCCVLLSYCLVCSLQPFCHLRCFFCGSFLFMYVVCVCHTVLSVHRSILVVCWERTDLLAL